MPRPKLNRFVERKSIPEQRGKCAHERCKNTYIDVDEYEALRLKSMGLLQKDAAEKMGISRTTYGRILDSCLRKVYEAITDGYRIHVRDNRYTAQRISEDGGIVAATIAVPVESNGDNPDISMRFGKAAFFAIVSIRDNQVISTIHQRIEHETCDDITVELKRIGVDAILVKRIGYRPKASLDGAGIDVHLAEGEKLHEAIECYIRKVTASPDENQKTSDA